MSASQYVDRVAEGECHILFLRRRGAPDRSLVTLQLERKKICQAQGIQPAADHGPGAQVPGAVGAGRRGYSDCGVGNYMQAGISALVAGLPAAICPLHQNRQLLQSTATVGWQNGLPERRNILHESYQHWKAV